MCLSLSSLQHLSASAAGTVVTLPVRIAARALGLARGTVSVVHDRVAGIDDQAEPHLVASSPADVAARIARQD